MCLITILCIRNFFLLSKKILCVLFFEGALLIGPQQNFFCFLLQKIDVRILETQVINLRKKNQDYNHLQKHKILTNYFEKFWQIQYKFDIRHLKYQNVALYVYHKWISSSSWKRTLNLPSAPAPPPFFRFNLISDRRWINHFMYSIKTFNKTRYTYKKWK